MMSGADDMDRESVAESLGLDGKGGGRRFAAWKALLVVLVLGAGGFGLWRWFGADPAAGALSYTSERVTRGDLVVRVSATGNLQPTTQVDVGSELSGTVEEVLVNDNDKVTKGQILARLDTSKLEDQVFQSQAALKAAQADVDLNEAGIREAQSNLERLRSAWRLSGGRIPAQSDLDTAQAVFDKSSASRAGALAAVSQAQAALRSARTNLEKAVIRSPIDGIVLLREVEPGQTVAASLQAPVLFVLAQDLTQMELQVDIDEADVGQVREGQEASFTVDAYPDRVYPAVIRRVRYGSETTNGVVTYQGVLQVANDDLSLRPGMTATASVITQDRKGALLVPNAALRYTPPASAASGQSRDSVVFALIPRPRRDEAEKTVQSVVRGADQTVWVLKGGTPAAVPVKVGITDGRQTEILSGELNAGDAVITDAEQSRT